MRSVPGAWQRTSPFAVVFFIGRTVRFLTRNIIQLIATFGALAVLIERSPQVALAIPAGVLAVVAVGVLRYWFFRFRVDEDRIHIRQGIARRTALDLPFDRVQGINVEQSLLDRILGLVTVSLDTAGSGTVEGQLPSVTSGLADDLRTRIRAHRPTGEAAEGGVGDGRVAPSKRVARPPSAPAESPGQVVHRLSLGDIVRIGLANRNFVVAAAFLGIVGQTLAEERLVSVFESLGQAFAGASGLVRTLAVAGIVLAGLAIVLSGAFLRYHGFTLWREGAAYRTRAGLLTQREVVVETRKVQQLSLSHNLVMRLLRRHRLRALPAAGQVDDAPGSFAEVLEVPLLRGPEAEGLRKRLFGREGRGLSLLPQMAGFRRVSPHYVRALALRISSTTALASPPFLVGVLMAPAEPLPGGVVGGVVLGAFLVWLASIPVAALIAWVRWRRRGYLHDDDGLASRSGFLGRRVDAFLFRKAQDVAVSQSPLQARKGLATLRVQLACGKVVVPYLELGVASRLRDHALYRVESSQRRWH